MWEVAEELGAMLVFAEHRYYGESLPFGRDSYSVSVKAQSPSKSHLNLTVFYNIRNRLDVVHFLPLLPSFGSVWGFFYFHVCQFIAFLQSQ